MSDIIAEALAYERRQGYASGFDDTKHRLFMQIASLPITATHVDALKLINALKLEDLACKTEENKT